MNLPRWTATLLATSLAVLVGCTGTSPQETHSAVPTTAPPPETATASPESDLNEVLAGHTAASLGSFLGDVDDAYWDVTRRDYLSTAMADYDLLLEDLAAAGTHPDWPPDLSYVAEFQHLGTSLGEALDHSAQDIHTSAQMYLVVREDISQLIDALSYDLGVRPNTPQARALEDLPEAAPEATEPTPQNSYSFDVSGKAVFEHFTVELKPKPASADRSSYEAEVCVLKEADPEPDGTTRVSVNPWRMITTAGQELRASPSSKESPQYPGVSRLKVGECVNGWLGFSLDSSDSAARITYANSVGESAQWTLPHQAATSVKPQTPTQAPVQSSKPTLQPSPEEPKPELTTPRAYDTEWASIVVDRIIRDIGRADEYLLDGPRDAYLPMDNLADHMRRLQKLGAPAGVDEAYLYGLTGALGVHYDTAYYYLFPDPFTYDLIEGAATYSVARGYTQELLDLLGPAIGQSHTLPPWSFIGE